MGYYMNQRSGNICIKKENFVAALAAIKALANKLKDMTGGAFSGGKMQEKWYMWVTTEKFVNAETLADALGAWRWDCYISEETGDLESLTFDGEKLGDDKVLLDAIAPFVVKGGYLEMEGEDGSLWRWRFDGKEMDEINADISWPE